MSALFDSNCTLCPRLVKHLREVKQEYTNYHCAPVSYFGKLSAELMIVGLAPGKHGANQTGRPFTGDYAGKVLYRALFQHGFATQAVGVSRRDGLKLKNCRITNAVKCLPPENKPNASEIRHCNQFLQAELKRLPVNAVILTLGRIAHVATLQGLGLTHSAYPFKHGALYELDNGYRLLSSYHCSRYNIHTKRLTAAQFSALVGRTRRLIEAGSQSR